MEKPESDVVNYSSPKPRGAMAGWVKGIIIAAVCLVITVAAMVSIMAIHDRTTKIAMMKKGSTKAQLSNLRVALETFETDNGHYPTQAEGLDAMVHQPAGMPQWQRLLDGVPLDGWGHDFRYVCPGKRHSGGFDLISAGPDGKFGTADDIQN